MAYKIFIRGIVKRNPNLKNKLKKAGSKLTPFQYINQTVYLTGVSFVGLAVFLFLVLRTNPQYLLLGFGGLILSLPFMYRFWFSYVDVLIRKAEREIDADLLFVSEYLLVTLESGLPLGNAIERLSKLDRPGGHFFKKIYTEFKTGKDLEKALDDGIVYSPSANLKSLLKRLKDSLDIGVDLRKVLSNFIIEASEKKIVEIRGYAKKLNPIVMMYLLLGIVVPSLGITFFIIGAALLEITPALMGYILIFMLLLMYAFQYFAYSTFKFSKSTI